MRILVFIAAIIAPTISHAVYHENDQFSKEDCKELYEGIMFLLSEADKSWEALETNPEGTTAFIEHTMRIQWAVDVAGNYTTIYDTFCTDK